MINTHQSIPFLFSCQQIISHWKNNSVSQMQIAPTFLQIFLITYNFNRFETNSISNHLLSKSHQWMVIPPLTIQHVALSKFREMELNHPFLQQKGQRCWSTVRRSKASGSMLFNLGSMLFQQIATISPLLYVMSKNLCM